MTGLYHATQLALQTGRKICPSCSTDKLLNEYSQRKDGHYEARCKDCIRAVDRARRPIRRPRKTPILPKATQEGHKVCNTCFTEKPYTDFNHDSAQKDGYRGRCIQCYRTQWDMLPEEEKHQRRKQDRESRQPRKEQIKALDRARHNTPEHNAKRRDRNAIKKMLDADYREALKQSNAQWRKNNPLRLREYGRWYKTRQKAARAGHIDYSHILERDGHYCYICEKDILPSHELAFDHKVPLHPRSGEPQGTHSAENIHPTHKICNQRKLNRQFENLTAFDRRGVE